jgi:phage-related protein
LALFGGLVSAVGVGSTRRNFMGLFNRIAKAINKVVDKVGDGVKAIADSVKSTVQSLGNAIKDIAAVAGCLLNGDIKGAMSKAASALGNLVNVAAFVACPCASMAASFIAGSVGGKAGDMLGMLAGGPKTLLTKGVGSLVKDVAVDTAMSGAMAMAQQGPAPAHA